MHSMNTGQYDTCMHIPCKDEERVMEGGLQFYLGLKVVFIGDRGTIDGIKATILMAPYVCIHHGQTVTHLQIVDRN